MTVMDEKRSCVHISKLYSGQDPSIVRSTNPVPDGADAVFRAYVFLRRINMYVCIIKNCIGDKSW